MDASLAATCSTPEFIVPVHAAAVHIDRLANGLMDVPSVTWLGFILAVLIVGIVIVPAIWSQRPTRRKAATEVPTGSSGSFAQVHTDDQVIELGSQWLQPWEPSSTGRPAIRRRARHRESPGVGANAA